MPHVHKPEHGSCGACPGASTCPMVYCPTCPTPVICEAAEDAPELHGSFGVPEQAQRVAREGEVWAPAVEAEARLAEAYRVAAQRPTLGRIVHVFVHPTLNNGSDVAPAVVTRVWEQAHDGSWLVNLRVFLDGTNHSHEWATSRHLHATEEIARKEHAEQLERLRDLDNEHTVCVSAHAFWPARS